MPKRQVLRQTYDDLKRLCSVIPSIVETDEISKASKPSRKKLVRQIEYTKALLEDLEKVVDPIKQPKFTLDPTNPKDTGMLIGRHLEEVTPQQLGAEEEFYGSGVYAIYYRGKFPAYRAICGTLCPIYVGKADPQNPKAKTPKEQGTKLCARL